MQPIKTIYIDMDGVVADWQGYMCRALDIPDIDHLNKHDNRKTIVGDYYKANPDVFLKLPVIEDFGVILTAIFSAQYHVYDRNEQAEFEIRWLSKIDGNHFDSDMVRQHKREWLNTVLKPVAYDLVEKYAVAIANRMETSDSTKEFNKVVAATIEKLFEHEPIILEYAQTKADYARTDAILIDDWDRNVEDFIKAGGYGLYLKEVEWFDNPYTPDYGSILLDVLLSSYDSDAGGLMSPVKSIPEYFADCKQNHALSFLQMRTGHWIEHTFRSNLQDPAQLKSRAARFLEEAIELAQATQVLTIEDAHELVDYVFGRPVGEVKQEIGGVCLTLSALASAKQVDLGVAWHDELVRGYALVDKIRAKDACKPVNSALPGVYPE